MATKPTKRRVIRGTVEQRLLSLVVKNAFSGCWNSMHGPCSRGYTHIWTGKKREYTHRVAYKLFVGPIPEGMFVCHSCDNRKCCNPQHLFLGTPQTNMDDKMRKGRAIVPRGKAHWKVKLTEQEAKEIRKLKANGLGATTIARLMGHPRGRVQQVYYGRTWKHIT